MKGRKAKERQDQADFRKNENTIKRLKSQSGRPESRGEQTKRIYEGKLKYQESVENGRTPPEFPPGGGENGSKEV